MSFHVDLGEGIGLGSKKPKLGAPQNQINPSNSTLPVHLGVFKKSEATNMDSQ